MIHEDGRELTVESSRRHRNRLLVKFQDTESRDGAEALRGSFYVKARNLRKLGEGEFWEHELVGLSVVDVHGVMRGRVARVIPGGIQDLVAVTTPAGERLVPLVSEIVVSVDVAGGRVVVDPPPGLLD